MAGHMTFPNSDARCEMYGLAHDTHVLSLHIAHSMVLGFAVKQMLHTFGIFLLPSQVFFLFIFVTQGHSVWVRLVPLPITHLTTSF
jgi:hypothetical protein